LTEKLFDSSVKVILGDGTTSKQKISSFVTLTQRFDSDHTITFNAVVAPLNPGFDLILGKPWLKRTRAVHDHGTRSLSVKFGKEVIKLSPVAALSEKEDVIQLDYKDFVQFIGKDEDAVHLFMVKFVIDSTTKDGLDSRAKVLLDEFPEVTSEGPCGSINQKLKSLCDNGKHHIKLVEGASPQKKMPYRMSPRQLNEVRKQVNQLLEEGKIRPSSSPWSAPVIFALKKDGTLRMCVDYRSLNRLTIPDSTPLPNILDNLDKLGGSSIFSVIDLQSGFNQIPMDSESIAMTAFSTRYGQYEYLVMPFGLRNAPSTFQRVMNLVLEGLVDDFCVVYLDDILVFSDNEDDHDKHLRLILDRLKKYGLLINSKKSLLFQNEVEYCGHLVSKGSVIPSPGKTKVIRDWNAPQSATEVRSFLGLCNFYRRFVKDFTIIAKPLLDLTKKDVDFVWEVSHQDSFEKLKKALCSEPVLVMPDYSQEMHVWPDASQFAVGGVLTQSYPEGHKPIAYFSKKLSDCEQKYPTHEREFYAIVSCLKHWRCYLDGINVIVHTDHKPLTWAKGIKDPKPRIWGWIQEVESFAPSIVYQKGSEQPGDALSRIQTTASIPSPKTPSSVQNDSRQH